MTLITTKETRDCQGNLVTAYRYNVGGQDYVLLDTPEAKYMRSKDYNFNFSKVNGLHMRWGATKEEDPQWCPVGPEILDLEISINGCPNACPFCYKENKNEPATNMTFETFKSIVDRIPKVLTQIAFGITGIQTNPDFLKMMDYCREIGVIPNFTLSGIDLTEDMADEVVKRVGALAVSAYASDKNVCYNTVKMFTDRGLNQTNIHLMVSQETMPFVYEVLNDRINDERLQDMHAIVFLGVKGKGRARGHYNSIPTAEYEKLMKFCFDRNLTIGFDSCSAPKFEAAVQNMNLPENRKSELMMLSESCESTLFSFYINAFGEAWGCSFSEDEPGQKAVPVIGAEDFTRDVWMHPNAVAFRDKLLSTVKDGCRSCPVYPEINI
jgi:MoaA/NifB/PqqE/SkfB family radical SAM enzyme